MSQFTKRLTLLICATWMSHSILYCQNKDSLKCFNIVEQKIIIKKLLELKECKLISEKMNNQIVFQDSIIKIQDGTIDDLKHKNELTLIMYQDEQKTRLKAEKEVKKQIRRAKIWRGSTILLGLTSVGLYIFK